MLKRIGIFLSLALALVLQTAGGQTPAPAAAAVRLACVGDSITFGSGLRDRATHAYPVRLAGWLGSGYEVRNFGVSGATLLHAGDRPYIKQAAYTNSLKFTPDIVVINLGANDSKHPGDGSLAATNAVNNWQFKSDFAPDYKALIAAFRAANPAVKVYVCLPTPDFPGRWGINEDRKSTRLNSSH